MEEFRRREFDELVDKNRLVVPSYRGSFRNKLVKIKIFVGLLPESISEVSKKPNLRCLSCGWKYNFSAIDRCPLCGVDKSRELDKEDPFLNPFNWILAGILTFAIIRFGFYVYDNF